MQLFLSSNTPWNARYCTEQGQTIYNVESDATTGVALNLRIKFSRILPPKLSQQPEQHPEGGSDDDFLHDSFAHLGEIDYHTFQASRIRYGELDMPVNDFFKKGPMSVFGRNRLFTGTDGKEYAWEMATTVSKLILNDGSKTPIAIFHRGDCLGGLLKATNPASLEIFPGGEHMADIIVITFVYVEKLRRDRGG